MTTTGMVTNRITINPERGMIHVVDCIPIINAATTWVPSVISWRVLVGPVHKITKNPVGRQALQVPLRTSVRLPVNEEVVVYDILLVFSVFKMCSLSTVPSVCRSSAVSEVRSQGRTWVRVQARYTTVWVLVEQGQRDVAVCRRERVSSYQEMVGRSIQNWGRTDISCESSDGDVEYVWSEPENLPPSHVVACWHQYFRCLFTRWCPFKPYLSAALVMSDKWPSSNWVQQRSMSKQQQQLHGNQIDIGCQAFGNKPFIERP